MAPTERAKLYREKAKRGLAEHQYVLGWHYYSGTQGLQENKWMAAALFRKAAVQGHAKSQTFLGFLHTSGEGVEQNLELAASWYRESAKQGHTAGQFHLGTCLRTGTGVEKNNESAVEWFCKAADAGHARAQGALADCYALGEGVAQSDALAVSGWETAAVVGETGSKYRLGLCYMNGEHGFPKTAKRAMTYMKAAVKQGYTTAIGALKKLRGGALELEPGPCASCGATGSNAHRCQGCSKVRYCNRACQKRHWASHRPDCGARKACLCFTCASDRLSGDVCGDANETSSRT